VKRHFSVVARNVSSLTFSVPKYPAWVLTAAGAIPNPPPLTIPPSIPNQYTSGSEKQVTIDIVMKETDPKYPKDPSKMIWRTVSSTIDIRN
jgi:hypothetical protein